MRPTRGWRRPRAEPRPGSPGGTRPRARFDRRHAARLAAPMDGRERHAPTGMDDGAGAPCVADRLDLGVHAKLGKHVLHVALHRHHADGQGAAPPPGWCDRRRAGPGPRARVASARRSGNPLRSKREARTRSTSAARWAAGRISSPAAARRKRVGNRSLVVVRLVIRPAAPAAITAAPTSGSRSSVTSEDADASERGGGVAEDLDGGTRELDHEHIDRHVGGGDPRLGHVADRSEDRDTRVPTGHGEVVRETEPPLQHHHVHVCVHPHAVHRHERSGS